LLSLREKDRENYQTGIIPKEGHMVLIEKDETPKSTWKVEQIIETIKEKDNRIRVAKIPSNGKIKKRAINQLYSLEIQPGHVYSMINSKNARTISWGKIAIILALLTMIMSQSFARPIWKPNFPRIEREIHLSKRRETYKKLPSITNESSTETLYQKYLRTVKEYEDLQKRKMNHWFELNKTNSLNRNQILELNQLISLYGFDRTKFLRTENIEEFTETTTLITTTERIHQKETFHIGQTNPIGSTQIISKIQVHTGQNTPIQSTTQINANTWSSGLTMTKRSKITMRPMMENREIREKRHSLHKTEHNPVF
jgi:hypothetical protein